MSGRTSRLGVQPSCVDQRCWSERYITRLPVLVIIDVMRSELMRVSGWLARCALHVNTDVTDDINLRKASQTLLSTQPTPGTYEW
jgi:hypothetical protein